MKLSWANILILVLLTIISLSCSSLMGVNIIPVSKDVELGLQIDQEIRKNPKEYPILKDRPDIKSYVEGIGKKILSSPEIQRNDIFAYQFELIKDDSTVNAFCTPGGYIYVYTGLLKFLDNEATLAGVIGHEIAHAERRHATKRMTAALGAEILVAVVLGEKPSQTAQIAANLTTGLSILAYGRAEETESDLYSIKYMQSTEYYPGAIRFFFEKVLGARSTRGGALERSLSTHPLPQDRVENVQRILAQLGNTRATEENLFSKRYQEVRRKLP
jgi:predicted Zn-dependent protease